MNHAESAPARKVWHQQDILAEIRKRGSTIAALSRAQGLSRGALQRVFYTRYPKGQAIVAEFIGVPLHQLWPQWYGPDDQLLPLQGGAQGSEAA